MLSRLRRNRWLAAFLVIASPAIGGQVMPVLHPCAMHDMAAMQMATPGPMASMPGSMASMPGHTGHAPGDSSQHHCDCTCIGCCFTAPAVAPTTPSVVASVIVSPRHAAWPVIEHLTHLRAALDLLPESTAPPLG